MVDFTQKQMDQFWPADKEDFIRQLHEDIVQEEAWVSRAWPPELIRKNVGYAVDRAMANGFENDMDIRIFAGLMFTIGPDFDQHPDIQKVLSDTSLSTEARWDKLMQDPGYAAAWDMMNKPERQDNWYPEGRGDIARAYPTTYMLPGFIALYEKVRKETYYFLEPGEDINSNP